MIRRQRSNDGSGHDSDEDSRERPADRLGSLSKEERRKALEERLRQRRENAKKNGAGSVAQRHAEVERGDDDDEEDFEHDHDDGAEDIDADAHVDDEDELEMKIAEKSAPAHEDEEEHDEDDDEDDEDYDDNDDHEYSDADDGADRESREDPEKDADNEEEYEEEEEEEEEEDDDEEDEDGDDLDEDAAAEAEPVVLTKELLQSKLKEEKSRSETKEVQETHAPEANDQEMTVAEKVALLAELRAERQEQLKHRATHNAARDKARAIAEQRKAAQKALQDDVAKFTPVFTKLAQAEQDAAEAKAKAAEATAKREKTCEEYVEAAKVLVIKLQELEAQLAEGVEEAENDKQSFARQQAEAEVRHQKQLSDRRVELQARVVEEKEKMEAELVELAAEHERELQQLAEEHEEKLKQLEQEVEEQKEQIRLSLVRTPAGGGHVRRRSSASASANASPMSEPVDLGLAGGDDLTEKLVKQLTVSFLWYPQRKKNTYLRVSKKTATVAQIFTQKDWKECVFRIVRGLSVGAGIVSIEAPIPKASLLHVDTSAMRVTAEVEPAGSMASWGKEASWRIRTGLAGDGISFESVAKPGFFLLFSKERKQLVLAREDKQDVYKRSATFIPVDTPKVESQVSVGVAVAELSSSYEDLTEEPQ